MLELDSTTFRIVAEKAAQDAADYPRWLNAIARAIVELNDNPFVERADHGGLLIGSPSGNCYSANGVCQCISFTGVDPETGKRLHKGGQPCWHRAAARIVRLHDERIAAANALADKVITIVAATAPRRSIAYTAALAAVNELF